MAGGTPQAELERYSAGQPSGRSSRNVPWLCLLLLACCLPTASPSTGLSGEGALSAAEGELPGSQRGGGGESPRQRRLQGARVRAAQAARRKRMQREADDPPDVSYGYAYAVDELLAQEREEQVGSQRRATLEACTPAVEEFVAQERAKDREGGQARGEGVGGQLQALRWMLFFLHVPRTGGRTYHQCFLKALFPVDQRCPRSYDALRFDLRVPACRLLATHNDYSLMTKLPAPNVSVMTNVRDPVDRVVSAYEFAMETAVRSLRWGVKLAPGESLNDGRRRVRMGMGHGPRTETRNVWPWHLLIPLLEDELWARRANGSQAQPGVEGAGQGGGGSSYERGDVMMPLSAFLEHPSVRDLLHNGATFHIAGITENSLLRGASFLRACASQHPQLGEQVLGLVRARLDQMLHIGLTAAHKESAVLLAAALGRPLHSKAFTGPDPRLLAHAHRRFTQGNNAGVQAAFTARMREMQQRNSATLLSHYEKCVGQQRKRYVGRRRAGLRLLGPGVDFSPEARTLIAPTTIQRIRELNSLDAQLLEYAQVKFAQQKEALAGRVEQMKAEEAAAAARAAQGAPDAPPVPEHGRRRLLSLPWEAPGLPGASLERLDRPALGQRRAGKRPRAAWRGQDSWGFEVHWAGVGEASLGRQRGALARARGRNCTGGEDELGGDRTEDSTADCWGQGHAREALPLAHKQMPERSVAVCCAGDGLEVN